MQIKEISESEKEIMEIIWEKDGSVSSSFIMKALSGTKKWKPQTVSTFLSRLVSKGLLTSVRHGTANEYTAVISRSEYETQSARNFIDHMYGGSVKNMIASLVDANAISKDDIDEIKKWFNGE